MPPFNPFSGARSRALRGSSAPKTPEPLAEGDTQPPSPPRPRFRLRKRNVSQNSTTTGPTQQFLASVATADIPIPSIEEPRVLDQDMVDVVYPHIPQFGDLKDSAFSQQSAFVRTFSPPKTPAPEGFNTHEFPDWSMSSAERGLESGSECELSRPSTARSTQTESSLFSYLSFTSQAPSQNVSPEMEQADRFGGLLPSGDWDRTIRPPRPSTQSAKSRKAQWTTSMSQHLWSTYNVYLQDPKVTPFRVSKSGIPPDGVCIRVARVAMRTWKGPKSQTEAENKSGSTTPTRENLGPYLPWPHTRAATRAHLRELCKGNGVTSTPSRHYLAASPTPYGRTARRSRTRRSAPLRSPSIFSPSDMVMSLALSTSESMQPQGPLAELTRSQPNPAIEQLSLPATENAAPPTTEEPEPKRTRLGSPFMAKSYGPSSSNSLAATLELSSTTERQSQTLGPRRSLRSPAPLNRTQPNSAKRRVRTAILESRRSKRPSLAVDFWDEPSAFSERQTPAAPLAEFNSTASSQRDNLFVPRTNIQELFEASRPQDYPAEETSIVQEADAFLRLGSPFSGTSSSHSVPNRISSRSRLNFGAVRRPFATFQQSTVPDATPARSSLASRLAYIDERLKDFRRRDPTRRRSQSPL